jgi:predicted secreted Zn-dependent protease
MEIWRHEPNENPIALIAKVVRQSVPLHHGDHACNGQLMAAAPEMLKALTDLMNQLECVGIATKSEDIDWTEMEAEEKDFGQWHGTEGMSFNQARKAIAKATGEAL